MLAKYGITGDPVTVEIWGSGKPMREFLWSEDMADACVYLMERVDFAHLSGARDAAELTEGKTCEAFTPSGNEIRNTHVNIGTGVEISIRQLAETIKTVTGFTGALVFNTQKPDGTLRKLTDVSRLHALGWRHQIELREGIERLYAWYKEQE